MDWLPYIPTDQDVQHDNIADFFACGPFSATHIKEMVVKRQTGVESDDSERALATLTPVTKQGSSLTDIIAAINKYGFISVNDWPELVDTNPNATWDEFYAPIPPEVLAKADKSWHASLRKLAPAEVPQALETAPVWTIISGAVDHIVAQLSVGTDQWGLGQYFDSYKYFVKDFQPAQPIKSQWQLLLTRKGATMIVYKFDDNPTEYILSEDTLIPFTDPDTLAQFTAGRVISNVTLPARLRPAYNISTVFLKH